MGLDGAARDEQPFGDLRVGEAVGDVVRHGALRRGEGLPAGGRPPSADTLHHGPGSAGIVVHASRLVLGAGVAGTGGRPSTSAPWRCPGGRRRRGLWPPLRRPGRAAAVGVSSPAGPRPRRPGRRSRQAWRGHGRRRRAWWGRRRRRRWPAGRRPRRRPPAGVRRQRPAGVRRQRPARRCQGRASRCPCPARRRGRGARRPEARRARHRGRLGRRGGRRRPGRSS